MSLNKVMIIGRLGKDPELKYAPGGKAVCEFSLATTEEWKDKDNKKQTRTDWHNIVVWGKLAELCDQFLSKGRQAFIEGTLQTRQWEGKHGQQIYKTEVIAKEVKFIDGFPQNETEKHDPKNQTEDYVKKDETYKQGEFPLD